MPITNAPLYPYGNTGITWLDMLLKAMQHDPFSIMPGQVGMLIGPGSAPIRGTNVLGMGENADLWRHIATEIGADNTYSKLLGDLWSRVAPLSNKDAAASFSAMLGGRGGGGTLHTVVPSQMAPKDDLAQALYYGLMDYPASNKVGQLFQFPRSTPPAPPTP